MFIYNLRLNHSKAMQDRVKVSRSNPINIGDHIEVNGVTFLVFSICHHEKGTNITADKL